MNRIYLILLLATTLILSPVAFGQESSVNENTWEAQERALELTRDERRHIQKSLSAAGFSPGRSTGLFGSQAREAIRAWQKSQGQTETGYLDADAAIALLDSTTTPEQERTDHR